MKTLGETVKTIFLKESSHALYEEFDVVGLYHTMTFSAALVTSNTINGYVGGIAMAQVTFATDSDTTMALVAAAITGMAGVKSASVVQAGTSDRVINVIPTDQVAGVAMNSFAVTNGASQATITIADVNKNIKRGMPVSIEIGTGKIQPLDSSVASTTHVGVAMQDAVYGEKCTVCLKGNIMVNAQWGISSGLAGPVAYTGFDNDTKYGKYTSTSVTATNITGHALDNGTSAGDVTRVILK